MYGERDSSGALVLQILFVLTLIFLGEFGGLFASPQVAVRTLEAQGYSNVQIVDHSWFAMGFRGCDSHDSARFTAIATNPAGKPSQVYVCTGFFFKGGTIRVR